MVPLDERARNARLRAVEIHESAATLHDGAAEFWGARGHWERNAAEQLKARQDRNAAAYLRLADGESAHQTLPLRG